MLRYTLRRQYSTRSIPSVTVNRTSHYELEIPYPPKNKPLKLCLQLNSTFFNLVESFYAFYITGKISIVDTSTGGEIDLNTKLIDYFNEPESRRYRILLNSVPLVDITNSVIGAEFNIDKYVSGEDSTFRHIEELQKQGLDQDAAQLLSYYVSSAMCGFESRLKTRVELEQHMAQVKDQFMDFRLRNRIDNLLNDRKNEILRLLEGLNIEKELMEMPIERKMKMYLLVILLVSSLQFGFFYYTIYCVDWLGWDIMEPITYSLDILSVLIVMRFFYRYKRSRSFNDVKAVFREKYFLQKPGLKLRYDNIQEKIKQLESKKQLIGLFTTHHI